MVFVKTLIFISESWDMRNYVMRSKLEKEGSNTTCRCGVRRSKCVEVMQAHALVWGMPLVGTSFSSGKHGCTFNKVSLLFTEHRGNRKSSEQTVLNPQW